MSATRIILNFGQKFYCSQTCVWYIFDSSKTLTVEALLGDISKKFKSSVKWNLFINDVIAPPWMPTKYLQPASDTFRLASLKECQKHVAEKTSVLSKLDNSCEKDSVMKCEGISVKGSSCNKIQDIEKPMVKINNNFKRKLPTTTPINKDRYTNRSKFYISPGKVAVPQKPVVTALKTAVTETIKDQTDLCQQDNLNKSFKSEEFKEKVSLLLSTNTLKNDRPVSDSDSSSSDTDSDGAIRHAKKPKVSSSKDNVSSSGDDTSSSNSSSAQPSKSNEDLTKQRNPPNIKDKSGIIIGNPIPSNSSGDSEMSSMSQSDKENSIERKKATPSCSSCDDDMNVVQNEVKKKLFQSDISNKGSTDDQHTSTNNEINDISKTQDYSSLTDLQGTPRVSDKVAFKMLDLNASYCPVVSGYKEGIIRDYNSSTQCIKIELFPSFISKQAQRNGKFEIEDNEENLDSLLELNLKQLIEPKLL